MMLLMPAYLHYVLLQPRLNLLRLRDLLLQCSRPDVSIRDFASFGGQLPLEVLDHCRVHLFDKLTDVRLSECELISVDYDAPVVKQLGDDMPLQLRA